MTVWHEYILRTSGNAYVCGGLPDRDSAAQLLIYCGRDYDGGRLLYRDNRLCSSIARKMYRRLRRMDWTTTDDAVSEYVAASLRTPGHKERQQSAKGETSRKVAAPLSWVLVEMLCRGNPAAIVDAWNTPFAVAACLLDAGRDIRGESDTLISETDEERIDRKLEEREAK